MDDILLSVIVPIYNAELYLEKCINSILNQTYALLEIILVDDGSWDSSGEICDRYAEKYKNITVIHQENKGLVESRKIGVNSAKGSAIAFVDADDWIEPDMYMEMIEKFITYKADVVTSGSVIEMKEKMEYIHDVFAEGEYKRADIEEMIVPKMMFSELECTQGIIASLCNKIFRKTLLQEEIQRVHAGLTYGEDGAVVYPLLARSECVYILHKQWYHYIQYENSMLHSFSGESYEKVYRLNNYFQRRYLEIGLLTEMTEQINQYIKPILINMVKATCGISMCEAFYLLPYETIPKASKLILYGAGAVGKSYYKSLVKGDYAEVVGWIDKEEKQIWGVKTEKMEILHEREYDYIVIAIENEAVAVAIHDMLLDFGISSEQIIWKKPARMV